MWVGLKPDREVDFADVTDALAPDLDGMRMSNQKIYGRRTYDLKCNWKLPVDGMLDSYHVTRLHKDTVGKYISEMPTVIGNIGPHIAAAAGRANFDNADIENFDEVRRKMVFSYIIFPNAMVVLSPDYINVAIVKPISFNRCTVDYYMMIEDGVDIDEARLAKSYALMDKVFGGEDFWAAELGQEGLEAGSLTEMVLGGQEVHMKMFHNMVASRLVD